MKKPPEFPGWPIEQVMEVAQMLYALRPFKFHRFDQFMPDKFVRSSELRWNELAQEAFDFLDKLHKACEEVASERSLLDAACRRYEKEAAEAKLPDLVPVEKMLRFITDKGRTKLAKPIFEKFERYNRRCFGKWFGERPTHEKVVAIINSVDSPETRKALDRCALTFWTLNGPIARYRKTGVPRSFVLGLRQMFKDTWGEVIAEENRAKAKRKGPRLNPKDEPVILEVLREKNQSGDLT